MRHRRLSFYTQVSFDGSTLDDRFVVTVIKYNTNNGLHSTRAPIREARSELLGVRSMINMQSLIGGGKYGEYHNP